jgi:hypothetical protein
VSPHPEHAHLLAAATQPQRALRDGETARPVPDHRQQRRRWPVSPATTIVVAAACLLSVLAYLHFYPGGHTIAYDDAKSHMLIARRVFSADTPGAGQLGGVWLPLPHILMLAAIWSNWAFYSGFAGSLVMMAAYVVCTLFVYKFVWRITGRVIAAAAGTAVFALNPNMLYMQSTPMTEMLMFATMMGAVYGLLRWAQTDDSNRFHALYLLGAGLSALMCALTRYEGWTLGVALTGMVLYCSLPRLNAITRDKWQITEGQVLAFGILGATGPLAWMAWNMTIFGDALAFQNGVYAKPSNWVSIGELPVHHLWISFNTYLIAATDTVSTPVAVLAVIGLVVYLWRTRLSSQSLPALSLLIMFPMFVVTLYKGQRPLHVYQYYHSFYNVRFGLVMLLPACVMVGFLVAELGRLLQGPGLPTWRRAVTRAIPAIAVIWIVVVIAVTQLRSGNIVTLEEPLAADAAPSMQYSDAAASWLRQNYAGGLMLMESYGNENVAYASHVPLQDQVYEGSYQIWQPSLADPSGHDITWIVMHKSTGDQVYAALHGSYLIDGYRVVWQNHDYLIFKWRGTAAELTARQRSRGQ